MDSMITAPKKINYGRSEYSEIIVGYEVFTVMRLIKLKHTDMHITWGALGVETKLVFNYLAARLSSYITVMASKGFTHYTLEISIPDEGCCLEIQLVLTGRGEQKAVFKIPVLKDLLSEVGVPVIDTSFKAA